MWHRPLWKITGETRDWTKTVKNVSSYENNFKVTGIEMIQKEKKVLPILVLRKFDELTISSYLTAVSMLLIDVILFTMRSCKYFKTSKREENQRTNTLRLRNIVFLKNKKEMHQSLKI